MYRREKVGHELHILAVIHGTDSSKLYSFVCSYLSNLGSIRSRHLFTDTFAMGFRDNIYTYAWRRRDVHECVDFTVHICPLCTKWDRCECVHNESVRCWESMHEWVFDESGEWEVCARLCKQLWLPGLGMKKGRKRTVLRLLSQNASGHKRSVILLVKDTLQDFTLSPSPS